jgi:aspartyl protease family protein
MDDPIKPKAPKEQTKTYGHWMGILAWVAILVVLVLLFDKWLAKSLNPNYVEQKVVTLSGIKKTVLTRNRFNHYLAKGKVNEHQVIFLVDTGASDVVIPGKLAEKLNLKKGTVGRANTAGGIIEIYRTKLDSITIGHIKINDVRASINPSMTGTEVLLGMSALKHVTFTQKGDTLTLSIDPES